MSLTPPATLAGARVLVTGASGFIGSHLVERLAADGADVAALARSRGRLAEIADGCPVTFIRCDLTDAAAAVDAIAGFAPDIVFHFASSPDGRESFAHARETVDTNVAGTLNALEALRLSGGATFLYGDTCKVYGSHAPVPYCEATPVDPASSYAISKLAGWHLCLMYRRLYRMNVVALRPTLIYGPRQGENLVAVVIKSVLGEHPEIVIDGGAQTRDPLFVADAVDACVAAAERARALSGRVINFGGGHEISVERLAHLIVDLNGGKSRVVCRPDRARATEMWRSYCDNAEAEALLGWRPRTPLAQGLEQTLEYMSEQQMKLVGGSE